MPAQRKPTNVLELHGSFKHDPARGRERADEPDEAPIDLTTLSPPSELDSTQAYVWRQLVDKPYPGTVTSRDVLAFTLMVKLWTNIMYRPPLDMKEVARMQSLLAQFGMTPADRSRVKVLAGAKRAAADPTDEFTR